MILDELINSDNLQNIDLELLSKDDPDLLKIEKIMEDLKNIEEMED